MADKVPNRVDAIASDAIHNVMDTPIADDVLSCNDQRRTAVTKKSTARRKVSMMPGNGMRGIRSARF